MPLELQRWFNIVCGILGTGTALGLFLYSKSWIPEGATGAHISLTVLYAGAMGGLMRVYQFALAVLLSRLWPELDRRPR